MCGGVGTQSALSAYTEQLSFKKRWNKNRSSSLSAEMITQSIMWWSVTQWAQTQVTCLGRTLLQHWRFFLFTLIYAVLSGPRKSLRPTWGWSDCIVFALSEQEVLHDGTSVLSFLISHTNKWGVVAYIIQNPVGISLEEGVKPFRIGFLNENYFMMWKEIFRDLM